MQKMTFNDAVTYDGAMKSAISVRDGVLEYLGSELGMEPSDRIFYVYRSPATIASAASLMPGIPLLSEHVEPGTEDADVRSRVKSASLVDAFDTSTASTLAIRNMITVAPEIEGELESGKRELSLGYTGALIPHDKYDFEQRDIIPTHLAVVEKGRCGSGCRFLDRKPTQEATMPKMHKAFTDADGAASLSQIVEIAAGLPEAIKNVPVDKLQELMPALQEIMDIANAVGVKPSAPTEEMVEEEVMDEKPEDNPAQGEQMPITDSAAFKDAVKAATESAVKTHAVVIDKARDFVGEGYNFADKSAVQIMRDALATQHGATQFTDSELPVAFKLLKPQSQDYRNFGDSQTEGGLTARIKASLKGDQ